MTLEKAIGILEYHRDAVGEVAGSEFANALKLGIEALKARQRDRAFGYVDLDDLLPGETKE